jgi:phosphonate transport system substrate-binding protein
VLAAVKPYDAQVIARDRGAQLTTVGATSPDDQGPRNAAVAVVRADSDLDDLADLEGQDVCFIDPSSTTGYLFGAAGFDQLGIDPENDVNGIFIGDHASAMRTMFDGECAAVFTFRENAEFLFAEEEDDVEQDDLRIIWSETVPEGGVSISTNLPETVQEELRDAMLGLTGDRVYEDGLCPDEQVREDAEGTPFCAMVGDGFWGLWPADDSYWQPVREVCEATNAPACA